MSTISGTTMQASGTGAEKLPDGVNRVALLTKPGTIVIEERPMPQVGPHDVLVEITAVASAAPTCTTTSMVASAPS